MSRNYLIAVDGIDGCGKTTLVKHIFNKLKELGHENVIVIRMLGSNDLSNLIRERVLQEASLYMKRVESVYIGAANIETMYNVVKDYMKKNYTVILDRYISSYYAYQCVANNDPQASSIFALSLREDRLPIYPDMFFYIDIDIEEANKRIKERMEKEGKFPDRKDNETGQYKEKVKEGFNKFFELSFVMDKFKVNGNKPIGDVKKSITTRLKKLKV